MTDEKVLLKQRPPPGMTRMTRMTGMTGMTDTYQSVHESIPPQDRADYNHFVLEPSQITSSLRGKSSHHCTLYALVSFQLAIVKTTNVDSLKAMRYLQIMSVGMATDHVSWDGCRSKEAPLPFKPECSQIDGVVSQT